MSARRLSRRWSGASELLEMLGDQPGGIELATRDFALVTLAGHLSASFPDQLVFKGGFVLRHVHGHLRFSRDVDVTRIAPPGHKLDADEVAGVIRAASVSGVVQFAPQAPATDSARSLDFDQIRVTSEIFQGRDVQVEVSYREAVLGEPVPVSIGEPYYAPFEILAMGPDEMAAEKLRALAQRRRETDLADLAVLLSRDESDEAAVSRFAERKFELVAQGRANRADRISEHIAEMAATYDDVVPNLFPEAPSYREARDIVVPRVVAMVPK